MKKIMNFSLAVATALIVTSCSSGGGKYWEGEASTDVEKIAQKACECIGQTMTEAGVDLDKLLAMDLEAMKKDDETLSNEEMEKKYNSFKTEMQKMDKVDIRESPCIKEVEKERDEKQMEMSDIRKAMKAKCKISKLD